MIACYGGDDDDNVDGDKDDDQNIHDNKDNFEEDDGDLKYLMILLFLTEFSVQTTLHRYHQISVRNSQNYRNCKCDISVSNA